jgi:hypothetical protein
MRKAIIVIMVIAFSGAFSAVRGQQANANLEGTIRDAQGGPLPGVEIAARDTGTGITRSTVSDQMGRYRFTALAPSVYDITAKLAGFKLKKMVGLELLVNETKIFNVSMDQATVEEEVTVMAEAPLIESTKAEVSTVVTAKEVDSLPLLTRQFANLALLAPGTTEMGSYDPTKNRMSHFSAGGFRGRAVYYSIDGADSKDNMVGGPVQLFTTEGVEEFSVATHQFKAEYGRTQGTVVTVVTKSGTNAIHGSLFGFFRDAALRDRTYFEKQNDVTKPKYHRQNFGGSVGGPIIKDKTHFFVAIERVQDRDFNLVDTFGIWPQEEGVVPHPFWENLATVNITHQINSSHSLKLRYGYQRNDTKNEGVGGEYTRSSGYSAVNQNHNLMLAHTWIMGSNLVNELRGVYQYFQNDGEPNSHDPTQYFTVGAFGQTSNMPQITTQVKYQIRDDLAWHVSDWHGTHDFKFGFDYYYMPRLDLLYAENQQWMYTHLPDTYSFDTSISPIYDISKMGGNPVRFKGRKYHSIGLYAQDDWKVTDRLTLNLGLRWDYNTGLEFNQGGLGSIQFLAGYYSMFNNPGLKHQYDNIAPRLGITYDLSGKGKTVVRGGFGIFYDQPYAEIFMYEDTYLDPNPWRLTNWYYNPNGITNPDGSFWKPADALPSDNIAPPPGSPDTFTGEYKYPRSYHYSVGFSHQISADFAIDVNYVHTETRHLGKYDAFNRYHYATDSYTLSNDYPVVIYGARFVGRGYYNGLYVSLRKRFSENFELRVNYTLSGGNGSVNYRGTDGWGNTCIVEGQPNGSQEFGPVDTDERHRLFLSGIAQLPFGFQFSTMVRWNTPRPYNITTGLDDNDDDYWNDVPASIGHRMGGRGTDNFFQMDFRLSRFFRIADSMNFELIFEVYNAFNTVNLTGYTGNMLSPNFGLPTDAMMPREAQLGIRFTF